MNEFFKFAFFDIPGAKNNFPQRFFPCSLGNNNILMLNLCILGRKSFLTVLLNHFSQRIGYSLLLRQQNAFCDQLQQIRCVGHRTVFICSSLTWLHYPHWLNFRAGTADTSVSFTVRYYWFVRLYHVTGAPSTWTHVRIERSERSYFLNQLWV